LPSRWRIPPRSPPIKLANGWADDPRAAAAVAWRREAAHAAGLTDEVQRLQYEWHPADGMPASCGRLVFRPEPDDTVMLNGYVDDILAEVTRVHAERGAARITATTDLGNAPMAAAFGRAGYRNVQARIILSAPTIPDAEQ
jgi:hypothetical protein